MTRRRVGNVEIPADNVQQAFTPWAHWEQRFDLGVPRPDVVNKKGRPYKLHEYGGVYLLAHFRAANVPKRVDPLDENIIYVGETGLFSSRWRSFQRAAASADGRGHSGAISYRNKYGVGLKKGLYLSALSTWFPAEEEDEATETAWSPSRRLRLRIEAELLWHLARSRTQDRWLLNRK